MIWEGSDRSRTRQWLRSEVLGLLVWREGIPSPFKLTCDFLSEKDFAEGRLDGIFIEKWNKSVKKKNWNEKSEKRSKFKLKETVDSEKYAVTVVDSDDTERLETLVLKNTTKENIMKWKMEKE